MCIDVFVCVLVCMQESNSHAPFLAVPTELLHRVDETSPLKRFSFAEFHKRRAELVLILTGEIASLGLNVEVRSSFVPDEIKRGYRFVDCTPVVPVLCCVFACVCVCVCVCACLRVCFCVCLFLS